MTSIGCIGSRASWRRSSSCAQRLRLTNVASVSGDIDLTTPDGQFQARILGAVAKKESDDKSRRIRRKHEEIAASGKVSGGGSRPYGYEADKVTVRAAEAAIVEECAQRLLAGEPVRSIARDLNERGVTVGERRRVVAAELAPDARLAADQRPARAQRRDRRDGGLARDHQRDGRRADPCAARRTRSGARTRARAAICSAGCLSVAIAASGWSPGRARAVSAATPARRGRASPAAARPTSTPTRSSAFVTEAVLHRLDSPRVAAQPRAAAAQRTRREALAATRSSRRRRSSPSSPTATGRRRDLDGRVAGRPQADRAAPDRTPASSSAKVSRTDVLDGYVGNGDELRARVGLARPQPAARDRRRRRRSVVVGPARRGYNRFDESRLTPRLACPERASSATLSSATGSESLTGTPWSAQVRSTHAIARAFRSSVPLRPAGGRPTPPLHRRRQPDPLRRRSHVAGGALDHVLGRSRRSTRSWPAGSPARPRSDAAPPAGARPRARGRRSGPDSGQPAAPPPSAPEPTGSPSSSLMCTNPCPRSARSACAARSGRPRSARADRARPDATAAPTHTANRPAVQPGAQLAEEPRQIARAAAAGRGSPRPR